jgi:5-methylcytosine-specific restriction protein A
MRDSSLKPLTEHLSHEIGLRFSACSGQNELGEFVEFTLAELDKTEGFSIRLQFGWHSLEMTFVPGSYAAQLISVMGSADSSSKSSFAAIARRVEQSGASISLLINGDRASASDPELWPLKWQSLSLSIKKSPLDLATEQSKLEEIKVWSVRFMTLLLALLPVEYVDEMVSPELTGYPEGALFQVTVNRYERDRRNRILCLQARGFSCVVCGFDFEAKYGDLGKDFIHVHHIVPVSQLGDNYVINPVADLVPICPNCHAMVHKRNPPLTVDELRAAMRGVPQSPPLDHGSREVR